MITANSLTANLDATLSKDDQLFIILSALNQDLATTIKDCECVSSSLLVEYQAEIIKALRLLA